MSPQRYARCVLFLVLALLTAPQSLSAQTNGQTIAWGAPVNGLQMAISVDSTAAPSAVPAITLHLRNVGQKWASVSLGGGCATASDPPRANAVAVVLTDSSGKSKRLIDVGPGPPFGGFCAGVGWVFLVPLPSGAEYSTPLNLDYYRQSPFVPAGKNDFARGWQPGEIYTLQAELAVANPNNRNMQNSWQAQTQWQGTLTSNNLQVRFPGP